VLSQVLAVAFCKDKGFADWLTAKQAANPAQTTLNLPPENGRRTRIGGTE
jgi:hypothetical protein